MTHPFTAIEHVGQVPGRRSHVARLRTGLSLHLVPRAGSKAQYMLDFGYTPEIVLRNADLLEIAAKIRHPQQRRPLADDHFCGRSAS